VGIDKRAQKAEKSIQIDKMGRILFALPVRSAREVQELCWLVVVP
jgi:hypothetical protein